MDGLSAGFPHFMVSLDHPSPEFSGLLLLGRSEDAIGPGHRGDKALHEGTLEGHDLVKIGSILAGLIVRWGIRAMMSIRRTCILISRIDMVLDHFLCLVGKIPHEVGDHEGKEDGMVVRGLLEESPEILFDGGNIGGVEDDVDRISKGADRLPIVGTKGDAVFLGFCHIGVLCVPFANTHDPDPLLSHPLKLVVESASYTSQSHKKHTHRFH